MFKYNFQFTVLLLSSFVLSPTISQAIVDNIVEKYIQEELFKDMADKKREKILSAARESFIENGGKSDEAEILNNCSNIAEWSLKIDSKNPFFHVAKAILRINNEISDKTIEEIIKTNDDCLSRLSKTEHFDVKTLLNCLKFSILHHTNS
ncbi:MAG TPA: hypothetical protein VL201_02020 [Patescibacteria group bacterium]|jgi:hypothetical protein|nr:hypothetical protein [Patescibacteria group bacterium]